MKVDFIKWWKQLLAYSALIVALLFNVIVPPPTHSLASGVVSWLRLVELIVMVVAVWFSGLIGKKSNRVIGTMSLVLGCVLLYLYFDALQSRTCKLEQGIVVIGTQHTPAALSLLNREPNRTCGELLRNFASDPTRVWLASTVYQNEKVLLLLLYCAFILFFAIGFQTLVPDKWMKRARPSRN